jgi:hypothetical protein
MNAACYGIQSLYTYTKNNSIKSIKKQLDADESSHAEERLLKQALRSHPLPPTDSQVLDSLSIPVNLSDELTGSLRQMRVRCSTLLVS